MPSIPSQSRLTKRSKCHKLLSAITAVTIISIHSIILPSLYNNLPQPMRTSQLSGQEYMDEVLNCDNTRRCQEGFRMRPEVFRVFSRLCRVRLGKWPFREMAVRA